MIKFNKMKKALLICLALISVSAYSQPTTKWGVKVKTNIKSFPVDTVFVDVTSLYDEFDGDNVGTQINFTEFANIYIVYDGKVVKTKVVEKQFVEQFATIIYQPGVVEDSIKSRLAKKHNVNLGKVFKMP